MKKPLNLNLDIAAEPIPVPSPAAEKKGPGRPPKPPRSNPKRIAVTLDDATYRRVAHTCVDLGLDRQEFLERAIALMLKEGKGG